MATTNINTTNNLSQTAQMLIDGDFIDNFKSSINSRDRWNALNRGLDIVTHLLSASTVVLAFVSGITTTPIVAIVAGALSALRCLYRISIQITVLTNTNRKQQ